MELQSSEKYLHKIDYTEKLFQIPNTLIGISFDISRINYIDGESPISLAWSGNWTQPCLVRHTNEDFYMAYNICNRGVGSPNNWASSYTDFTLNPPGRLGEYEFVLCNGGSKEPIYYFMDGENPPTTANLAMQFEYNNMSMTISTLMIFDTDFINGVMVNFRASYVGFQKGEGNGQMLMFYTITPLPALYG